MDNILNIINQLQAKLDEGTPGALTVDTEHDILDKDGRFFAAVSIVGNQAQRASNIAAIHNAARELLEVARGLVTECVDARNGAQHFKSGLQRKDIDILCKGKEIAVKAMLTPLCKQFNVEVK